MLAVPAEPSGKARLMPTFHDERTLDSYTAEIAHLNRQLDMLRAALKAILPLAEGYLRRSAPSHPDNAKLEDARAALSN
jgi:hypothetical protein